MKRSSDRDSPPSLGRSLKRVRNSSVGRYDDSSDERMSPDRVRRRVGPMNSRHLHSPSPPPRQSRYMSPLPRDSYLRSRDSAETARSYPYKVLCVSALHPKASDEVVKDTLYREYKKFGDLSIRISHEIDERVAYVCFRNHEDAQNAKRSKPRILLFDKVAIVEPVYEEPPRSSDLYRSRRSLSPLDYDRHYYRSGHGGMSPPPPGSHMLRYDRVYGTPMRDYRLLHPHADYLPRHVHGLPHIPPGVPPHYLAPRHLFHPGFRPHLFDRADKKDKFPNYLTHIPPEEDPLATRTLFAGNLEINITEEELKRIFGQHGVVEDIDIKRPPPGTGNAFAFVRYQTLDMAHRAKVELSGQYIGKFQCKIGYGKAIPTTRVWVGGLGSWTSVTQLEREFDRFGAIKKIEYTKGESQAFILYDSIDAAQAAVKEMRGFPLGGPDKKLRIDFADAPGFQQPSSSSKSKHHHSSHVFDDPSLAYYDPWMLPVVDPYAGKSLRRGPYERKAMPRPVTYPIRDNELMDSRGSKELAGNNHNSNSNNRSRTRSRSQSRSRSVSGNQSDESDSDEATRRVHQLTSCRTLPEVARKCTTMWQGALTLKKTLFHSKCHLITGDADIIENLMKDETGKRQLRITQRLHLDEQKLDDVEKRMASSSHAIFLGMPGSANGSGVLSAANNIEDPSIQTRPIRNLVSYLKQKEAAGVISLLNKETEATGVLYAFPPCAFSAMILKRSCPNMSEEAIKEDHLIIVVCGGNV